MRDRERDRERELEKEKERDNGFFLYWVLILNYWIIKTVNTTQKICSALPKHLISSLLLSVNIESQKNTKNRRGSTKLDFFQESKKIQVTHYQLA